jgi:hypothetical protein
MPGDGFICLLLSKPGRGGCEERQVVKYKNNGRTFMFVHNSPILERCLEKTPEV